MQESLPRQHGQSLGRLPDTQGVLVEHVNGGDKQTRPGDIIGVEVAVRDGGEQLVVLSGESCAADGNPHVVHETLQGVDVHLPDNRKEQRLKRRPTLCSVWLSRPQQTIIKTVSQTTDPTLILFLGL